MGSNIKKSIFDEQTKKALTNWTNAAKKKNNVKFGTPQNQRMGGSPGEMAENSPKHPGQSGLEMSSLESRNLGQTAANITASVDIPGENQSPHNSVSRTDNHEVRDLLTGP